MNPQLREKAIERYQIALTSGALEGAGRGSTHARLGVAYAARTEGDRLANLGLAIEHLEKALDYLSDDADRARAHRNLSIALRDRAQHDGDDVERALEHGRRALALSDPVASPLDWSDAQRALGESYLARPRGERVANVESALACFGAALEATPRHLDPERWASSHLALGYAHSEHPDRTRNRALEIATHCRRAQGVFTRESHPEVWRRCEEVVSSVLGRDPAADSIRRLAANMKDRLAENDPFAAWPAALLERAEDPAELPRGSTPTQAMSGLIELVAPKIRETVATRVGGERLTPPGILRIRVVEDWDINAQIAVEPPYDVYISTNLFRYCSTMSGLLVAGMGLSLADDDGEPVGGSIPPALDSADAAVHARHVMRAFLSEQEIPVTPIETGPGHTVLTTMIFFSTVAFLIAHEFGHVIVAEARRRNEPVPFHDYARAMVEAVFDDMIEGVHHPFDPRGLEDRDVLDRDAVSLNWTEEIACDVLAASLALEFQSRDGPWSRSPDILPATKFAIHLALISQMMLSLYANLAEGTVLMTPSHPPMDFRTHCVLRWMYGDRAQEAEAPVAEYAQSILTRLFEEFVEPSA